MYPFFYRPMFEVLQDGWSSFLLEQEFELLSSVVSGIWGIYQTLGYSVNCFTQDFKSQMVKNPFAAWVRSECCWNVPSVTIRHLFAACTSGALRPFPGNHKGRKCFWPLGMVLWLKEQIEILCPGFVVLNFEWDDIGWSCPVWNTFFPLTDAGEIFRRFKKQETSRSLFPGAAEHIDFILGRNCSCGIVSLTQISF